MRRAQALGLTAVAAVALAVGGCGSDDHPNENRPPDPVELTGKVTNEKVTISPDEVGAGLAVITVANLSSDPIELTFEGPTSATAPVIEAGNVGNVKLDLEEGAYTVGAGGDSSASADQLDVGPERPSSQNELLLP